MSVTVPSNIGYGRVVGRFLQIIADTGDADLTPDAVPLSGTVYFTPSIRSAVNASATPAPVTIVPSVVSCILDSEGYISDFHGNRGIYLIATNDPDLNPVNWTYSVSFKFSVGDLPSFSIYVPENGEVDLSTAIPVGSTTGTETSELEIALQQATADAAAAEAALTNLDPTTASLIETPTSSTYIALDNAFISQDERGVAGGVAALDLEGYVLDGSGTRVTSGGGGGGGGTTDHGSLEGLSDDDHPQYALADGSRGSFASPAHSHAVTDLTATGTRDSTTVLHGDNTWKVPSGSGGTSDHGSLDGLSDDDHLQYLTEARGDARYYTQTQLDTSFSSVSHVVRWNAGTSTWESRDPTLPFGVVYLSTNDAAATAPTDRIAGDIWMRHPDSTV